MCFAIIGRRKGRGIHLVGIQIPRKQLRVYQMYNVYHILCVYIYILYITYVIYIYNLCDIYITYVIYIYICIYIICIVTCMYIHRHTVHNALRFGRRKMTIEPSITFLICGLRIHIACPRVCSFKD